MDRIILDEWYIPLLWLCFLASLAVYFQKHAALWLKLFPPFMLITVLVETVGQALGNKNINNTWLFNTYGVLELPFYLLVIRANIENKAIKIIIAYSVGLVVIIKIIDFFTLKPTTFHYVVYNLASLLIVFFSFYYFYKLFKANSLRRAFSEPAFWICTGLVVYFTGAIPIWALYGNMQKLSLSTTLTLMQLHVYLNLAIYSLFIVGFLCKFSFRRTQT